MHAALEMARQLLAAVVDLTAAIRELTEEIKHESHS